MSRVVDSSYLIMLVDGDDPRQEEARKLASDPSPLLVPPEVIGETLGVLQARTGFEHARTMWNALGDLPNLVHLNTTRMEEISPIFEAADGALSWTDAAVVAHCLREDAEPLCYDDGIVQAYLDHGG